MEAHKPSVCDGCCFGLRRTSAFHEDGYLLHERALRLSSFSPSFCICVGRFILASTSCRILLLTKGMMLRTIGTQSILGGMDQARRAIPTRKPSVHGVLPMHDCIVDATKSFRRLLFVLARSCLSTRVHKQRRVVQTCTKTTTSSTLDTSFDVKTLHVHLTSFQQTLSIPTPSSLFLSIGTDVGTEPDP